MFRRSEEKSSLCRCNVSIKSTQSANAVTYVKAEILFHTSSANVAGSCPLTVSTIPHITHFISLFIVVPSSTIEPSQVYTTPLLRKNINTAAMLTSDTLLRHLRQVMYHGEIGGCALLSLIYSWYRTFNVWCSTCLYLPFFALHCN